LLSDKLENVTRSLQETGLAVKRLQMQHHRAANAELAVLGVSLIQWDALRHLAENPDASLHELAMLTFQTDQSFGALAARLLSHGLIERIEGPGRAVHHRLTAKGSHVREAGAAIVDRVLVKSFAPLTAQQRETFDRLLQLLVTAAPTTGTTSLEDSS
jgi:DNA-binding MarR family transcriptional regulator